LKQSVISVSSKTFLNKIGICIYNIYVISAMTRRPDWFHTKLQPPHFTTKLRPSVRTN